MYSFAIVLWEIFTHEIPHKHLTGPEVAYAVAHKDLRPKITKTIPLVIARIIRRCWNDNPQHRPGFSEILELLIIEHAAFNRQKYDQAQADGGKRSLGSWDFLAHRSPLANFMLDRGPKHKIYDGDSSNARRSWENGVGGDREHYDKGRKSGGSLDYHSMTMEAARRNGRSTGSGSLDRLDTALRSKSSTSSAALASLGASATDNETTKRGCDEFDKVEKGGRTSAKVTPMEVNDKEGEGDA